MSVKDLYKVINIYDNLTGVKLYSFDYDDFYYNEFGGTFLTSKIQKFLEDDKELIINFGYKS